MSMKIDPALRLPTVLTAVGKSRSQLYRDIEAGKFPAPIKLGERAVGWRQSTIEQWLDSRSSTKAEV